jgi:hypothetical protein
MNNYQCVKRTTCFSRFLVRTYICTPRRRLISHLRSRKLTTNMELEEYGVLKNALASKTPPVETAIAFTKPTREAFVPGRTEQPQLEEHFSRSWNGVIDVAIDTPHKNQEALVDILRAVQQQNVADSEEASEIEIWGDKVKVWKDMPLFGSQAREIWNRGKISLPLPLNYSTIILTPTSPRNRQYKRPLSISMAEHQCISRSTHSYLVVYSRIWFLFIRDMDVAIYF